MPPPPPILFHKRPITSFFRPSSSPKRPRLAEASSSLDDSGKDSDESDDDSDDDSAPSNSVPSTNRLPLPIGGPAIDELECKRNGWMVGVVYRRTLARIPKDSPFREAMLGIRYHGQSTRTGWYSPRDIARNRWKRENAQARRETHHEFGLIWAIRVFGEEAFDDELVAWYVDEAEPVHDAINREEIANIAGDGGVMRSRTKKLRQTLNLTNGGTGYHFDTYMVQSEVAWEKAKIALLAAVEAYGSANIPTLWVNKTTGHKTGGLVNDIRNLGGHWRGHPDESERVAWLSSLPGWTWAPYDDMWEAAKIALLAAVEAYGSANIPGLWVHPISRHASGALVNIIRHQGTHWRGKPDEAQRVAWLEGLSGWKWSAMDNRWEANKIALTEAVAEYGSACIPYRWVHPVSGHPTGHLITTLRHEASHHLWPKGVEADRRAWLGALRGWSWNGLDSMWDAAKIALMAAVAILGTARIRSNFKHPTTKHATGKLVEKIRRGIHLKGKPDEAERRAWLEALPGWWWGRNPYKQ